jgi:outer membrane protein OmpA-like peptidoglycan-associated protein
MKNLLILFIVTIIGVGGMIAYKLSSDNDILDNTDYSKIKHTINIGVDNWAGYFYLCSKKLRKIALDQEILVQCQDDGANFQDRAQKLKDGDLQFAAFTVDSYVKNAEQYKYPASFVAVIDESRGGDAIYVNKNIATTVDELRKVAKARIAYTSDSPSEMLVTTWKRDFGIEIDNPNKFTLTGATGSSDAYQKLISGQVDVAVLWQPEVAKAEEKGYVKLLGSDETKNLIVDALVVQNKFMVNNPDLVAQFMEMYYQAMDYYATNSSEFDDELEDYTGINSESQLDALKDGIKWQTLVDNGTSWFGLNYGGKKGNNQLFDSINMVTRIMINDGQLTSNPLPAKDAFKLVNSKVVQSTFDKAASGSLGISFMLPTQVEDLGLGRKFKKLSPGKWTKLRKNKMVGSVNIPSITFKTGVGTLYPDASEQESFKRIAEILTTYPRYRVIIEGHTGRGDASANMELSKQRANKVKKEIIDELGVNKNRLFTIGYGATSPVSRLQGESKRSWWKRWARVNIIVVQE